jgi:SAM-dependent methyltransferase
MSDQPYFPENEDEITRLEGKTDTRDVIDQARWAGLEPGMRILDVGCGPGITTATLAKAAQPGGSVVGIDRSEERIAYARDKYADPDIEFICRNFFHDLSDLGEFDFIWVRFVLEYFRSSSPQLALNVTKQLKPGGILCLADLDMNSMIHYGAPERLQLAINHIREGLERRADFDPFAGRKLPTLLSNLGFTDIRVEIRAHHLIFGELSLFECWHWWKKMEIASKQSGYDFAEYPGGINEFEEEFKAFFANPDRFTYTPLILVRGIKQREQNPSL